MALLSLYQPTPAVKEKLRRLMKLLQQEQGKATSKNQQQSGTDTNNSQPINYQDQCYYFFPDVIADRGPVNTPAAELFLQSGGQAKIYIYEEDPTADVTVEEGGEPIIKKVADLTTEQHTKLLADEISVSHKKYEKKVFFGYSTGSHIIGQVALALENKGHQTELYIIDEPSYSEITRQTADKGAFDASLIKVAEHSADRAGLLSLKNKGLDQKTPNNLLPPISCIDMYFKELVNLAKQKSLDSPDEKTRKLFDKFIKFLLSARRNLHNFILLGNQKPTGRKLSKVNVIFTDETARKHGAASAAGYTGGWEQYSKEVEILDINGLLANAKHSTIIDSTNSAIVVDLMIKSLHRSMKPKAEAENQLKSIIENAAALGIDYETFLEMAKSCSTAVYGAKSKLKAAIETTPIPIVYSKEGKNPTFFATFTEGERCPDHSNSSSPTDDESVRIPHPRRLGGSDAGSVAVVTVK